MSKEGCLLFVEMLYRWVLIAMRNGEKENWENLKI